MFSHSVKPMRTDRNESNDILLMINKSPAVYEDRSLAVKNEYLRKNHRV